MLQYGKMIAQLLTKTFLFLAIKTNHLIKNRQKMNRLFTRKDIQIVKEDMKRCSKSSIMRKMYNKIIMRYYCISTRMDILKITDTTHVGKATINCSPIYFWWSTLKNGLIISYKFEHAFIWIWKPKRNASTQTENIYLYKHVWIFIIAAWFIIVKHWKKPKHPSTGKYLKKNDISI